MFGGILQSQPDGSLVVRLDPRSRGIPPPSTAASDGGDSAGESVSASVAPSTQFDKICFVITPIGDDDSEQRRHANMVLKTVIEPVVSELGLIARRADQIDRSGIITQQIFEY